MVQIFKVVLQRNHEAKLRFSHREGALPRGTSVLHVTDGSGRRWDFICKSEGGNLFCINGPEWNSFARSSVNAKVTLSKDEDENYKITVQ